MFAFDWFALDMLHTSIFYIILAILKEKTYNYEFVLYLILAIFKRKPYNYMFGLCQCASTEIKQITDNNFLSCLGAHIVFQRIFQDN